MATFTERFYQALGYEAGGLLVVTPGVQWLTNQGGMTTLLLMVVMSLCVITITPFYNIGFEVIFPKYRIYEKRHWRFRSLHAVGLEVIVLCITIPIISYWHKLTWLDALILGLQISFAYVIWAYIFFLIWDRTTNRKKVKT